jgi:hypothetical protein
MAWEISPYTDKKSRIQSKIMWNVKKAKYLHKWVEASKNVSNLDVSGSMNVGFENFF